MVLLVIVTSAATVTPNCETPLRMPPPLALEVEQTHGVAIAGLLAEAIVATADCHSAGAAKSGTGKVEYEV